MPNWCSNSILVDGADEDVNKFFNELHELHKDIDEEFSFNKYVPIPPDLINDSYDWCIENWGCKWDTSDAYITETNIVFQTPWGPPIAFMEQLAAKYPYLEFELEYDEEGGGFDGYLKFAGGNKRVDESHGIEKDGVISSWGKVINPGYDILVDGYPGVHCFLKPAVEDYDGDYEYQLVTIALKSGDTIEIGLDKIERYNKN